jgi:hypothetical protein
LKQYKANLTGSLLSLFCVGRNFSYSNSIQGHRFAIKLQLEAMRTPTGLLCQEEQVVEQNTMELPAAFDLCEWTFVNELTPPKASRQGKQINFLSQV